jgi:hypothetical protein
MRRTSSFEQPTREQSLSTSESDAISAMEPFFSIGVKSPVIDQTDGEGRRKKHYTSEKITEEHVSAVYLGSALSPEPSSLHLCFPSSQHAHQASHLRCSRRQLFSAPRKADRRREPEPQVRRRQSAVPVSPPTSKPVPIADIGYSSLILILNTIADCDSSLCQLIYRFKSKRQANVNDKRH